MKAVVFHDVGNISLDEVDDPRIQDPTDAVVRLTASALCGTDLHFIRGTMSGMQPGTVLGHEGVGVVEEVGAQVRNLRPGDRVVVPSTIGCGACSYCRAGYFAQCDRANPNGPNAGTAFFGGPALAGPYNGMQAEAVRVPFAHTGCVKLPDEVSDDQAILLSDIFPTAYFGAKLAEIAAGDTIAIFGCGPVGLFAIKSAQMLDAGRVLAIDQVPSRLDAARALGAEVIDFSSEHPVQVMQELTNGAGPDRVIDAVGVDAEPATSGPAAEESEQQESTFAGELEQVAPQTNPQGGNWVPGQAPSQALQWAVEGVAKAGTISIIGVYPPQLTSFPIGLAMMRNLSLNMGNCNHRRYIPRLIEAVRSGAVDPLQVLTQQEPLTSVIEAYEHFDERQPGWVKVALQPVD